MHLSEDTLQRLLDAALSLVDVPAGCAAVLEGSIAAGFGNASSDIDFLLIDDSDREHVTMPTILFLEGRRVEVRLRSTRQLARQNADLLARAGARRVHAVPEDLLNRCQRLSCALPLRRRDLVERVRSVLPAPELERIVSSWFRYRARQSARYAVAMEVLGRAPESARWVRTALLQAAKTWVSERGETYLERKWISQQLARVPGAAPLAGRLDGLLDADPDRPPCGYLPSCLDLVADFGVDGVPHEPDRVEVRRRRGVTTWQIGDRVHVVRDRDQVFALGRDAGRAWRSIVFGASLRDLVERIRPRAAASLLSEFHRLGLIGLAWRRGGPIAERPPTGPVPGAPRPLLSMHGAHLETEQCSGGDGRLAVELLPVAAGRFAAAGMALVWANVMSENAREDMIGAIEGCQWGTVEATAHRRLRQASLGTLSSYGVHPLPAAEEAVLRLRTLPGLRTAVADEAARLERSIRATDRRSAQRLLCDLDALVDGLRGATGAGVFPSSFDSADGWRETLEVGHDWLRLGGYLDATLPLDEARDLVAAGGGQPLQRAAGEG